MTKKELIDLENELYDILPCGKDGMFGTDGSHESLMDVFKSAWLESEQIATKAINALKKIIT